MFRWLLLSLATLNPAFAALKDHIKPVGDKSGFHQMRNIDFIYLINLDQRPEKYESCMKQLAPFGIHPHRFSAVNGWELSLDAIDDVGVKYEPWMLQGLRGTFFSEERDPTSDIMREDGRTYFCHGMTLGAIGIVLSHLSILQDAYDSGYETIWVMEDDIEIFRDPFLISELIDELDSVVGRGRWDILFTDQNTKDRQGNYVPCTTFAWRPNFTPDHPSKFNERVEINSNLRRLGARYGAYSMIVRRSGMKKLLDFLEQYQIFLPFDMDYTLPTGIQLYATTFDIVSTEPNALTDNAARKYHLPKEE